MSEYEQPERADRGRNVTVDDVRELAGAATPHFSLHIRNRLRRLVAGLPPTDPARQLAEREISRLEELAVEGETRGPRHPSEQRLND
ncbi:MAG TPA: hypothetical protein VGO97_04475 [Solirubrobacterales bacterium]|nr:hypothetical protein [Solirubrobacterales bacterium]